MTLPLGSLILISYVVVGGISAFLIVEQQSKEFRFSEPLRIVPRDTKPLFSHVGAMQSVRQCGCPGRFIQWRRETCELTLVGPCVHPANVYTRGDLSFVPSENADALGIRGKVFDEYGVELSGYNIPRVADSAVEAGKEYSLLAGLSLEDELIGRLIKAKVTIYRASDKKEEVCAETDMLIV